MSIITQNSYWCRGNHKLPRKMPRITQKRYEKGTYRIKLLLRFDSMGISWMELWEMP